MYTKNNVQYGDKRRMIFDAMNEAHIMANLAYNQIATNDPSDTTKHDLWGGALQADIQWMQERYRRLLSLVPWTYQTGTVTQNILTIYCGGEMFIPYISNTVQGLWVDTTSGYLFPIADHGNNPNAKACEEHDSAMSLSAYTKYNDQVVGAGFGIIVLCHYSLVEGNSADGYKQTRATLEELKNAGELQPGRSISNIGYQYVTSFTMMHELLHFVDPEEINHNDDDIYGFWNCINLDIAKGRSNPDSLAYYGLSRRLVSLDPRLAFVGGTLGFR